MEPAFRAGLATAMQTWREIIRFVRQPNRVIGAIGQPVLFWLLFSAGMNRSFQTTGQRFSHYYIPGTLVLIVLFTAIFATISIIEDRREGFLQSVLVAPTPRWTMVLGKIAGGALLALGQSLIFLVLAITLGIGTSWSSAAGLIGMLGVSSVALVGLGFVIAWRMDSTQGFHAIMNLLLMPMWLLSGAFFPVPPNVPDSPWGEWLLHWLMRVNPVTYAVAGVRHYLFFGASLPGRGAATPDVWLPDLWACWLVTGLFCAATVLWAWRSASRIHRGDLQ